MKLCPKCGAEMLDEETSCTKCDKTDQIKTINTKEEEKQEDMKGSDPKLNPQTIAILIIFIVVIISGIFIYTLVADTKTEVMDKASAILMMMLCVISIFLILLFSIFKLRKMNKILAIVVSTITSCILMIPISSSYIKLSEIESNKIAINETDSAFTKAKAKADAKKAELERNLKKKENLELKIKQDKQSIDNKSLRERISLLESSQVSMQNFQKIAEVSLLKTKIRVPIIYDDEGPLKKGRGIIAEYYQKKPLIVITHNIDAKFGIDLNRVKIKKINDNSVEIYGIHCKYIGDEKNETEKRIKEIRTINYKNDKIDSIDFLNDKVSVREADDLADNLEKEFQDMLNVLATSTDLREQEEIVKKLKLSFVEDGVIKLAENFLRFILSPVFKNIKFSKEDRPDALPLVEFLGIELKDEKDKLENLNRRDDPSLESREMNLSDFM